MKAIFTFLFTVYFTNSFGQTCRCESDTLLNDIISCDTIKFDNNTSLYWNFNCDSSWLTFQDAWKNQEILFSLGDGLQEMTGRLGFIYIQEFKNTFLIQNNVISGCCTPPGFYLFNKTTGKSERNLGPIIFYSKNKDLPFIISFKGSNEDTIASSDFDSLCIYNVNTKKERFIGLVKGEIQKALKEEDQMHPESLFEEPDLSESLLTLTYPLNRRNKQKHIIINLKNYN